MDKLTKSGFDKVNIISYGNMFLIGNGHLGYRGTLEEFSKDELVGLNVVGFYDQYQDKWRESINMPNPFKVIIEGHSILKDNYLSHKIELDLNHAIFKRKTEFSDLVIESERFISSTEDNLICFKYQIKAKENQTLAISLGLDKDIYEINGPHFKEISIKNSKKKVIFKGLTNENKKAFELVKYLIPNNYTFNDGMYNFSLDVKKGKSYTFFAFSRIIENKEKYREIKSSKKNYQTLLESHKEAFRKKWDMANVKIMGNKEADFNLKYSIYHLLILGNEKYDTGIPARGVSGETYKGAIFWDTEIFMLPFYTLTNPNIAKKLLEYRVKTLKGAKAKAKEFGYKGAFYAWESQETGLEACSKYNVTDPITGIPIRTYFNEKQIHLCADISYAFIMYSKVSGDDSLFTKGGVDVLIEVAKFFMSYAIIKDGLYHLNDVIGPDEYHERIDDNAFTTYMAYYAIKWAIEVVLKYQPDKINFINKANKFLQNYYLPKPDNSGVIEQFTGYFNLEDTTVDIVRSRLKHKQDYWGGKNGVATPTRVIKQADLITLMVLMPDLFNKEIIKKNFEFYYPYTEHGSSLSSSMYSIAASKIGKENICYEMFMKSASIDLGTNQKMFAGGIYIGGTHPASNGGAYLSLIFGMCGLKFTNDGFKFNPKLPNEIKQVIFKFIYHGITYKAIINKNSYEVEEIKI